MMIDFSVLIPVYNTRPEHLLEAVTSVLNQTIKQKYNVVLVDDGSTNQGTLIALQYLRTFPQIKVFTLPENQGTSAALNKGHELIESEYIAIMGADDISHKERFLFQTIYLQKHPYVDVLGCNLSSFLNDDIQRKLKFTSQHPAIPVKGKGWQTNHGTVIYKNQAVKDLGGYNLQYRRGQDIELWNRMMAAGKVFRNLHDNLYLWRKYPK